MSYWSSEASHPPAPLVPIIDDRLTDAVRQVARLCRLLGISEPPRERLAQAALDVRGLGLRHYMLPTPTAEPDHVQWLPTITRIAYSFRAPPAFNGAPWAGTMHVPLSEDDERALAARDSIALSVPADCRWWERRGAYWKILHASDYSNGIGALRVEPIPVTDRERRLSRWKRFAAEGRGIRGERSRERRARTEEARAEARVMFECYEMLWSLEAVRAVLAENGRSDIMEALYKNKLLAPRVRVTKKRIIELDPAPSYKLPALRPGDDPQTIGAWSLQPLPELVDEADHTVAREWMAEHFDSADSARPHGRISIPYAGERKSRQNPAEWTEDLHYCAAQYGDEKNAEGFRIVNTGRQRALRELGRVRRRSRLPRDHTGRCTIPMPDLAGVLERYRPGLRWAPRLAYAVLERLCAPPEKARLGEPATPDGHARLTSWGRLSPRELCGAECPTYISRSVVYWIHRTITPRVRAGGGRKSIHGIVKALLDESAVGQLGLEPHSPPALGMPDAYRWTRTKPPSETYCNCSACVTLDPDERPMWDSAPSWWPLVGLVMLPDTWEWQPIRDADGVIRRSGKAKWNGRQPGADDENDDRRARTVPNVVKLIPPYSIGGGSPMFRDTKSHKETGT